MENHYFSVIGVLAQGQKSLRKTINRRLEINMNIVGKIAIFKLKTYEKSS